MNKVTRFIFSFWLVIASPTPCFADAPVTLNADVEVTRLAVRLSDLFNGVPPSIDRDIAQAPAPCKPAIYDESVLNKLADTYRLDWHRQDAGADHAVVTSSCMRITSDMIRDEVIARIKQSDAAKDRSFEVAFDNHALEVDLPLNDKGSATPSFELNNFAYDPVRKAFRADLTAQTIHGPYSLPVTGHVDIKRPVPILAHRIEAGTTISENDLDWIQVPEERITADVMTDPRQLIGRELRRDKAEDEIFHAHDVVPQRLVIRGSLVTMRIATALMTVTTQGKAEQDGAVGDTVRVLNTQSNRIIEGTVTGPGVVEIHTAQKLAAAE